MRRPELLPLRNKNGDGNLKKRLLSPFYLTDIKRKTHEQRTRVYESGAENDETAENTAEKQSNLTADSFSAGGHYRGCGRLSAVIFKEE